MQKCMWKIKNILFLVLKILIVFPWQLHGFKPRHHGHSTNPIEEVGREGIEVSNGKGVPCDVMEEVP